MCHSYDTYLPWFILKEIPHVGNALFNKLVNNLGLPNKILNASKDELASVTGISRPAVKGILNHKKYMAAAQKELELILENKIKIVCLSDPDYPVLLKKISDPPPVLTYYGKIDNQAPCLSVVGSRNATQYGLSSARYLSGQLAKKGFQIVSGLARGIDTMAHNGALENRNKTIAVLGSGLKHIYPKENKSLFNKIAETGTVFSEFKVNNPPKPAYFPIRNRIIAGLSCGTLVVEAAKRSGSLITARLAGEYNREVFAVPGSIKSAKSHGTHALLKQGAKLVEDDIDIIVELGQFIHQERHEQLSFPLNKTPLKKNRTRSIKNNPIIDLLGPYPVHIDELIENSTLDSATVSTQLLNLELSGQIIRHHGNYYSLTEEHH